MTDYIIVAVGGLCILVGAILLICEVIGVYRFGHSLSRMHASALGDTGGLFFCILGLIIFNGLQASSLKLAAIVAILWTTSPVSGHLLSRLIAATDDEARALFESKEDSR